MKVGCFALINPFSPLEAQLDQIKQWGFSCGDLTDNSDGACLGVEYGFTALASLDSNPFDVKRMFESRGLELSSVCAHANLLDPTAPSRYGTAQIIKAFKLAGSIGVKHVITAEGEPETPFGKALTTTEAIFSIAEKLYEPLKYAEDYGVKILIEPHGHISDSVTLMGEVLDRCNSKALGINLDTGNLWLGGGDSLEMIATFGSKIEHVHWKDLPAEMIEKRGTQFGCGMSLIALGDGVIDIEAIFNSLVKVGFDGYSTLEIAGEEAVLKSFEYLKKLGAV
ncbi:MAG: xylose isomerase [Bacteroidetes bacterium GWF2_42_66]|nr:MAG: xylose isomerase [Bacteroidetes bacterium GWA2_42_15]OFY02924.1 MAG: xylose isomerase [Bacteroidetes bacterium GWE2_42_39]OFY44579.1 MAG: xylose isomerase [Bacteroidetes bacterium GWF2_42_66]HAZ04628.1 sugar phosphate isomerase/epimerase [Marinilabiliales bacterium]HBL74929.1 sugar phosphate isomerase/epimerase [Prolixibacteraceae bacterium]